MHRLLLLFAIALAACNERPITLGSDPTPDPPCNECQRAEVQLAGFVHMPKQPLSVVTGDFDEDGRADFVVWSDLARTITFAKGNGDGTFEPVVVRGGPGGVLATGDLDNDGHLDLVAADDGMDSSITNWVMRGTGKGTFGPETPYQDPDLVEGYAGPSSVLVADLNEDGWPDVAYARSISSTEPGQSHGRIEIRLNRGDGALNDAIVLRTSWQPVGLVAADLNGDGHLDLVSGHGSDRNFEKPYQTGAVHVFVGHGDGTFESLWSAIGGPCMALAVVDLDRDGAMDLATADCTTPNQASPYFDVLRGVGDGTFGVTQQLELPNQLGPSFALAAGDFDSDGNPDVIVPNFFWGDTLSVEYGDGRGGFARRQAIEVGYMARSLAIADFNGDNAPDVAVVLQADDKVAILVGAPPKHVD